MKILTINPGHNGSVAFWNHDKFGFYIEEERLSRQKYDGNPYRGMVEAIQYGVEVLIIAGTSNELPRLAWTGEDPYSGFLRKFFPNLKVVQAGGDHHLGHAASAFFNSDFNEAAAVVIDGAGTRRGIKISDDITNYGFETETIFDCSYDDGFTRKYSVYGGNPDTQLAFSDEIFMDSSVTLVKAYEAVSEYLGFGYIEAGKTMGLAPYGQKDDSIPDLFVDGRANRNILIPNYPAGAHIDQNRIKKLRHKEDPKAWHTDPSKVTEEAMNLAWSVQEETQKLAGDLIEKAADITGKKNIVIAGGYGLNCVANYYYKKRFPNLNIYVDPISHDGGTTIGLGWMTWIQHYDMKLKRPLTTLYLGPERDENYHLLENYDTKDVTPADVAKLISEKNIVTIFQGRSEAGPRALGNRSILYDPTDPQGKDVVNKVKGREWFRPFAGSMLKEYFEEWFETYGMEESPFMMYAMDFKTDKHGECPAITHVDGTCRIQTVTREQNEAYYDLIEEFRKITGVPILFNTSFNLAGEPLVETLEDALHTMENCDIKYMYLPEVGKLVTVASEQIEEDPQTP